MRSTVRILRKFKIGSIDFVDCTMPDISDWYFPTELWIKKGLSVVGYYSRSRKRAERDARHLEEEDQTRRTHETRSNARRAPMLPVIGAAMHMDRDAGTRTPSSRTGGWL